MIHTNTIYKHMKHLLMFFLTKDRGNIFCHTKTPLKLDFGLTLGGHIRRPSLLLLHLHYKSLFMRYNEFHIALKFVISYIGRQDKMVALFYIKYVSACIYFSLTGNDTH